MSIDIDGHGLPLGGKNLLYNYINVDKKISIDI